MLHMLAVSSNTQASWECRSQPDTSEQPGHPMQPRITSWYLDMSRLPQNMPHSLHSHKKKIWMQLGLHSFILYNGGSQQRKTKHLIFQCASIHLPYLFKNGNQAVTLINLKYTKLWFLSVSMLRVSQINGSTDCYESQYVKYCISLLKNQYRITDKM